MVTVAGTCKERAGASMAVRLAGLPVIFTTRNNELAGSATSAALLTVGQVITRKASCLTRTRFDMTGKRIEASPQQVLTVCGSQEARMVRTACALFQAVGTKKEPPF